MKKPGFGEKLIIRMDSSFCSGSSICMTNAEYPVFCGGNEPKSGLAGILRPLAIPGLLTLSVA
nr:hypothetical protein [uncultured Mediterraneibacter sp.]